MTRQDTRQLRSTKHKVRHNADLALESCIQQDLWHSLGLMCFSECCLCLCLECQIYTQQATARRTASIVTWVNWSRTRSTRSLDFVKTWLCQGWVYTHWVFLCYPLSLPADLRNSAAEPTQRSLLWDVYLGFAFFFLVLFLSFRWFCISTLSQSLHSFAETFTSSDCCTAQDE